MRWQLESLFPNLESFRAERTSLTNDLAAALTAAQAPNAKESAQLERNLVTLEQLGARASHCSAYIECHAAADTKDTAIRSERGALAEVFSLQSRLASAVKASLRTLDPGAFDALCARPALATARHAILQMWKDARSQMGAAEEDLAAVLGVDGIHGWGRLYDTLSGSMEFDLHLPDGTVRRTPMSQRRSLMANPDRAVREAAFRDGQKPWNDHADTLAAALNAIAGTRLKLAARRGGRHHLDDPLHDACLSRASLDAMMRAILAGSGSLRSALLQAAKRQGTSALAYFDLEAPQVAEPAGAKLDWPAAVDLVSASFGHTYPALGNYFGEMISHRWIEAEARPGKRPGAFCTSSPVAREERVYMTHNDTMHDIVTLAHEVGHAWHSALLRQERPYRSSYPMTLAETASNFGEIMLFRGMRDTGRLRPEDAAFVQDQLLLRASGYLLNIPMRFEFENRFYTERAGGEVSVQRLRELMTDAQRTWYGEALLPGGEDPMFWASKMHFYISELSFYNFPYAFGFLLAHAIAGRMDKEGTAVLARYERFLAASGAGTCEEVCRETLGFDLTSEAFWSEAVASAAHI